MTEQAVPTLSVVPITPDTARELSRAAKQVESFRQRRDALVVQAHAEGGGLREIGRLTGMTHRAIAKILERTDAGGSS